MPIPPDVESGKIQATTSSVPATAAVPPQSASSNIQSILKSVHLDLMNKNKKKSNVVISGLASSDQLSDAAVAANLISSHWNLPTNCITNCKRLGKESPGKIRPLLVVLDSEASADLIIREAKTLRNSRNEVISRSVFVNPDRTKAESLALYELREQRRAKEKLKSTQDTTSSLRSTAPIFIPAPSSQEPARLISSIQLPNAMDSTITNPTTPITNSGSSIGETIR